MAEAGECYLVFNKTNSSPEPMCMLKISARAFICYDEIQHSREMLFRMSFCNRLLKSVGSLRKRNCVEFHSGSGRKTS